MSRDEIVHKINNVLLESLGVFVENAGGIFDLLSIKEPDVIDWPGEHGLDVDLSQRRYQARTITLTCGITATSADQLAQRIAATRNLLGTGIVRYEINAYDQFKMAYDVYCKDGFKVRKSLRQGKNIAWFTLTLVEPLPVKRIYCAREKTVSFSFISEKNISISWGDRQIDPYCLAGQSHTYSDGIKKHYIIIAGDVENLVVTTNCVLKCEVYS